MHKPLKILLLEDQPTDAELIQRLLLKDKVQHLFRVATDKNEFLQALDEFSPEVILSDNSLLHFDSREALKIVKDRFLLVPFILVTGTVSDEFAATIIKEGADDYILKDRMTRLPDAIQAGLNKRRAMKELKDYKYALDQSAIVSITDPKGIIQFANDNFCRLSKYSAEELIGQDHRIVNSGYHPKSFIKGLWETITNGKIWRGELKNKAKDGSFYWVDSTIIPFLDNKSVPYQYMAIRIDITEKKKAEEELVSTLNRLSFHIHNAPLGFIEWDNHLQLVYWSEEAEKIFGWTQLEFQTLQKKGYSYVYEEDRPSVTKIVEKLLSGELEKNTLQHRCHTKDNRVIWCEWFDSVLKDKDGKVVTILSLVRDITEKKKAEEVLLQSEMRLKQSQEIVHLGHWEINFETNSSKWSDEAYRIYGLVPADHNLSMEEWISFVHPEDVDYVRRKIEESWLSLSNLSFHHRIVRKDGTIREIYTQAKFELNKDGQPTGLYGIAHDVTESKKAIEELRRSNERFQSATQATSDIIWELNFETKQYLVHHGKEKLFSARSILDWRLGVEGKYVVEEDREMLRKSFEEARIDARRILWRLEYRVLAEDNTIMHIINHAMFIRDEGGKAIRAIGAITNITEKKKLEAALLDQQRHELLNLTATTLAAQEKERNAIGVELHDNVNQILVGTHMMLSLIKDDPEKGKEYLATCISSIKEAIHENRKIAHELVSPDLSISLLELIRKIDQTMLETAGLKTYLQHETYQEDWLTEDQKLAVYRIVQEQFTNIIKYAKAASVTTELASDDECFHMVITDDGIGTDPGAKTKGIGLTNMKSRLSVFNGTAVIGSAPGKGFRLEVTIPFNASF